MSTVVGLVVARSAQGATPRSTPAPNVAPKSSSISLVGLLEPRASITRDIDR